MDRVAVAGTVIVKQCVWFPPEPTGVKARYLVRIKQDDGVILNWFTSQFNEQMRRYEVGCRVEGTAALRDDPDYARPNSHNICNLRQSYRKAA